MILEYNKCLICGNGRTSNAHKKNKCPQKIKIARQVLGQSANYEQIRDYLKGDVNVLRNSKTVGQS